MQQRADRHDDMPRIERLRTNSRTHVLSRSQWNTIGGNLLQFAYSDGTFSVSESVLPEQQQRRGCCCDPSRHAFCDGANLSLCSSVSSNGSSQQQLDPADEHGDQCRRGAEQHDKSFEDAPLIHLATVVQRDCDAAAGARRHWLQGSTLLHSGRELVRAHGGGLGGRSGRIL